VFERNPGAISRRRDNPSALIRLFRAGGLLVVIFFLGTLGYYILGNGEIELLHCAYMTVITLTTIGYGEVIEVTGHSDRMVYTIVLTFLGMGVMLYFVSTLTAFIIDGELRALVRSNRMRSKIEDYENHFIIAGIGETGRYVLEEMRTSNRPVVVIERDADRADELIAERGLDVPVICGDGTEDATLKSAGIERAAGVVFSLGNDRDNLFATITARRIDPQIRIVTRGEDPQSEQKFLMAGATSVIYTNVLGGMRMAAEVIRPQVTTFLDLMMRDHGHFRRVEELPIPDHSPMIGEKLRDTKIRHHTDALIIAIYDCEEDEYHFNPTPDYVITQNTKLIVLTLVEDIPVVEALIEGEAVE
jgi:voltage-gated potassium channel